MDAAEHDRIVDEIFGLSSLLKGLSPEHASALRRDARARTVAPRETIVAEGSEVERLWFVVDGEVEVSTEAGGERLVVKTLGRGAFFGEVSIQSGKAATASVTALGPCTLVGFAAEAVRALIASDERTQKILAGVTLVRAKETIGKVLGE